MNRKGVRSVSSITDWKRVVIEVIERIQNETDMRHRSNLNTLVGLGKPHPGLWFGFPNQKDLEVSEE